MPLHRHLLNLRNLLHSPAILLLATHYSLLATAPEQSAGAPPLTLDYCITQALQKNFNVEIQTLARQSSYDDLEIAKAIFDTGLSATAGTSATQTPSTPAPTDHERTNYTDFRVGASQKVITGATLNLTATLDSTDRRYTNNAYYNPAYDSTVSLKLTQPLLKNLGPEVTRANIVRAKIGTQIAASDFKLTVLSIVNSVEIAYYNLAYARELIDLQKTNLAVSKLLLDENTTRKEIGVGTDLEILQSKVSLANDENALLLAENELRNQEDILKALISRFELDAPLGSIDLGKDPAPEVTFDHSYSLARAAYPDYETSQLLIQQLQVSLNTAKNKKLPSLDLGAGVGYNARENTYGRAANQLWGSDGYNWQVDLTLSFPWGLRSEKAQYRQAKSSLAREQLRSQQTDQDIMTLIRTAVRAVQTNTESLNKARLATQLSIEQYRLEKARYDEGATTFRRVQESQRDTLTAAISELQARIRLRIALSNLSRLETTSLKTYNIALD